MNDENLDAYKKTNYLKEGHQSILNQLKPIFENLIDSLKLLPEGSDIPARMFPFEVALTNINEFSDEIETEERETILSAIYELGEFVGLTTESEFAEEWRGDW
jgi:hypothetical protein